MKQDDGNYQGVYCHWDGYLSNNGRILLANYQDKGDVESLIAGGDMSSLGERVEPIGDNHSYENRESGTTVYYHRDREENWENVKPSVDAKVSEVIRDRGAEYAYLYEDGRWMYTSLYGAESWEPLTEEAIMEDA
jgi:hypothetical protein